MNAINRSRSAYPDVSEIMPKGSDEDTGAMKEDGGEAPANAPTDTAGVLEALKVIAQFVTGLNNPELNQSFDTFINGVRSSFGSKGQPQEAGMEQGPAPEEMASEAAPKGFNPFEAPKGKPGTSKSVKVM